MLALSETLAAAANDPAALSNFLGRLQQEATRLASLVQDLLALSRLEGGPLEHQPVRLDLVVVGRGRPPAPARRRARGSAWCSSRPKRSSCRAPSPTWA